METSKLGHAWDGTLGRPRRSQTCETGKKRGTCTRLDGNPGAKERQVFAARPPRTDHPGRNETEGTVNTETKDHAANERVERLERAIQERARRLEILDRQAVARKQAEDLRLQEPGGR